MLLNRFKKLVEYFLFYKYIKQKILTMKRFINIFEEFDSTDSGFARGRLTKKITTKEALSLLVKKYNGTGICDIWAGSASLNQEILKTSIEFVLDSTELTINHDIGYFEIQLKDILEVVISDKSDKTEFSIRFKDKSGLSIYFKNV